MCDDGNDDPDDGCHECMADQWAQRGESCLVVACQPDADPPLECLGVRALPRIDVDGDGHPDLWPPFCLATLINGCGTCLEDECCIVAGWQRQAQNCIPLRLLPGCGG